MTVKISVCIAAVVLAFPASISTGYSAQPARVLISQIKAHPNRYDGRTVEVLGILDSRHLGVFLRSRTSDDLIRLRFVLAERSGDIQIVRDSLFDRLRELAEKSELPGEPQQKFEVLMVGRIRILKEGGQPRKKYYPQIESPVRANTYTGAFHLEGGCTKVGCIPPSAGKNEILRRGWP